jgi:hypothetical protein
MDITGAVGTSVAATQGFARQSADLNRDRQAIVRDIGSTVAHGIDDYQKKQKEKEASAQFEGGLVKLGVPEPIAKHVVGSGNVQAMHALLTQAIEANKARAMRGMSSQPGAGGPDAPQAPSDNPLSSTNAGATSLAPDAAPPAAPSAGGMGGSPPPRAKGFPPVQPRVPAPTDRPFDAPASQQTDLGWLDSPEAVMYGDRRADLADERRYARSGFDTALKLSEAQEQKRLDVRAKDEERQRAAETKANKAAMAPFAPKPDALDIGVGATAGMATGGVPGMMKSLSRPMPMTPPDPDLAASEALALGTDPAKVESGRRALEGARRFRAGGGGGGAPKQYVAPEVAKAAFDEAGQGHLYDPNFKYTASQLPKKPAEKGPAGEDQIIPDDVGAIAERQHNLPPGTLKGKSERWAKLMFPKDTTLPDLLQPLTADKMQRDASEHVTPAARSLAEAEKNLREFDERIALTSRRAALDNDKVAAMRAALVADVAAKKNAPPAPVAAPPKTAPAVPPPVEAPAPPPDVPETPEPEDTKAFAAANGLVWDPKAGGYVEAATAPK